MVINLSKVLQSVDSKNTVEILDRLSVLSLCRDAMDMGLQIRIIPQSTRKCGRIIGEMLSIMRPDFQKVPRLYTIEATSAYRVRIGKYQLTTCPWAVQICPQTNQLSSMAVTLEAKKVFQSEMLPNYQESIITGPIGQYAKSHGFYVMYKTLASGDIIVFAGSKSDATKHNMSDNDAITIMRENLVSPRAYCQCVAYIYDELIGANEFIGECREKLKEDQKTLGEISKRDHKEVPTITKAKKEPVVLEIKSSEVSIRAQVRAKIEQKGEELVHGKK